MSTTDY